MNRMYHGHFQLIYYDHYLHHIYNIISPNVLECEVMI